MGILQDLIDQVSDSTVPLSTSLLRTKVFAARLRNKDFKKWLEYEAGGYPVDGKELPPYRIFACPDIICDFYQASGSSVKNLPISVATLPDEYKPENLDKILFMPSIKVLEQSLEASSESSMKFPIPSALAKLLTRKIVPYYECLEAWQPVSPGHIDSILNSVRTRLLDFLLKLEELDPQHGDSIVGQKGDDKVEQSITNIFHHVVMGNNSALAAGSTIIQQQLHVVNANDLQSLTTYLKDVGIPEADITELETAIAKDGTIRGQTGFGKRVSTWLGKLMEKAAEGGSAVSLVVVGSLVTEAIKKFYELT